MVNFRLLSDLTFISTIIIFVVPSVNQRNFQFSLCYNSYEKLLWSSHLVIAWFRLHPPKQKLYIKLICSEKLVQFNCENSCYIRLLSINLNITSRYLKIIIKFQKIPDPMWFLLTKRYLPVSAGNPFSREVFLGVTS